MASERKNVSYSDEIELRAQAIIKARGFKGKSDLVQTLIREEYERRHPPVVKPVDQGLRLNESPASSAAGTGEDPAVEHLAGGVAHGERRRRGAGKR